MKKSLVGLLLLCTAAFAAAPEDTLVLQLAGTMDTFDPQQAYDSNVVGYVATNIYETLITFEANTLEVVPLLATSWEQSEDGLSYTFTLREGVTFHSGNPMTCADAEYSFRRLLVTGNSSSTAFLMSDPLLGFPYWDEELAKSTPFAAITKAVSCDGEGKLVFTLAKPSPTFFLKLTGSWGGILDQQFMIQNGEWDGSEGSWQDWIAEDVSNSVLNQQSAGTGAYRMASRQTDLAVFQVFADYWGETPALKNVVVQAIAEDASRVLAIQNGDADLITYESRSVLGQVEGAAGVTVNEFPSVASSAIFFNQAIAEGSNLVGSGQLDGEGIPADFFADIHVRRGFAAAFDQERYLSEVLEGKGEFRTMAIPSILPGYDATLKTVGFDLELAEQEFKQAFDGILWEKGFVFEAQTVEDGLPALELLKQTLERLNPKFRMNVSAALPQDLYPALAQGSVPLTVNGTSAEIPDAEGLLVFFYSSQGTLSVHTHFVDEQIDALLLEASTTLDADKRATLFAQIGARGAELVPFIVLPEGNTYRIVRTELTGFVENYNLYRYTSIFWKSLSK